MCALARASINHTRCVLCAFAEVAERRLSGIDKVWGFATNDDSS